MHETSSKYTVQLIACDQVQATRCRRPGAGDQVQATRCRRPGAGDQVQATRCRRPGAGDQVQATRCRRPGACIFVKLLRAIKSAVPNTRCNLLPIIRQNAMPEIVYTFFEELAPDTYSV